MLGEDGIDGGEDGGSDGSGLEGDAGGLGGVSGSCGIDGGRWGQSGIDTPEYPPKSMLRPVVQHCVMANRISNPVTLSSITMTERAACCRVTLYTSNGLSSPMPRVELVKTGFDQCALLNRLLMELLPSCSLLKKPPSPSAHAGYWMSSVSLVR